MTTFNGKDRRHIFYEVEYTEKEHELIREFREYVRKDIDEKEYDDPTLLRYLYSGDLKPKEALDKLKTYHEWMHNPAIQNLCPRAT